MSTAEGPKGNPKLFILAVYKWDEHEPIRLAYAEDLESYQYFERKNVRSDLQTKCSTIVQNVPPGTKSTLDIKDAYNKDLFCFVEVS